MTKEAKRILDAVRQAPIENYKIVVKVDNTTYSFDYIFSEQDRKNTLVMLALRLRKRGGYSTTKAYNKAFEREYAKMFG